MGFQPGWAGGPGRPKQKPFLEWCKKWTVEKAEKYLLPIAQTKGREQLEAIKLIMSYAIGKPFQATETSIGFEDVPSNPTEITSSLEFVIAEGAKRGLGASLPDASNPGVTAPQVLDS